MARYFEDRVGYTSGAVIPLGTGADALGGGSGKFMGLAYAWIGENDLGSVPQTQYFEHSRCAAKGLTAQPF